jgi:hypothetical protein
MHTLRFGSSREFFEVCLSDEIRKQNWARARVRLAVEGFVADVSAFFDKEDFVNFYGELQRLDRTLSGTAKLEPLDQQVSLALTVDARGHLKLEGHVWSRAACGNKLSYSLEVDQTYLKEPLQQLHAAIDAWAEE